MKRILTMMIAVLLLCTLPGLSEASRLLGKPFPDFTVTTTDGETFALSEALKTKKAVFINVFATWCPPCEMEFPALQAAYEACADDVAVIVLSGDADDTMDMLSEYRESHALTMPFAREEGTGIANFIGLEAFPTSIAVDRFGNVSLVHIGAELDTSRFENLFRALSADDYAETATFDEMPQATMDVPYPDAAALSAALNADGGALEFRSDPDEKLYPFLPDDIDGRQAVAAANATRPNTTAWIETSIAAAEGDALAFDFACDIDVSEGILAVSVDGERTKLFSGKHDWTTWAIPMATGEHAVAFSFMTGSNQIGEDAFVALDDVRVLSGDAAAAALASQPTLPVAERFATRTLNDGARQGRFTWNGEDVDMPFWVVGSDTARIAIDLPADIDPEAACAYDCFNYVLYQVSTLRTEDGSAYVLELPLGCESLDLSYSLLQCWSNPLAEEYETFYDYYYPDEAAIQETLDLYAAQGYDLEWEYLDAPAEAPAAGWAIAVVDQNGDPVPGVIVNICTDDTCEQAKSDEDGHIAYDGETDAWHLQILKSPEGYSFDKSYALYAEDGVREYTITVTKG